MWVDSCGRSGLSEGDVDQRYRSEQRTGTRIISVHLWREPSKASIYAVCGHMQLAHAGRVLSRAHISKPVSGIKHCERTKSSYLDLCDPHETSEHERNTTLGRAV